MRTKSARTSFFFLAVGACFAFFLPSVYIFALMDVFDDDHHAHYSGHYCIHVFAAVPSPFDLPFFFSFLSGYVCVCECVFIHMLNINSIIGRIHHHALSSLNA